VSDVVTGEAVVLDLRPVSFASRALALALDLLVQVALATALSWATVELSGGLDPAAEGALIVVILVAVIVGVPTTVETLTRGKSLGKWAAGTRVVRDDGGPVRFRHALLRALVGVFEIYLTLGGPALVTSLANRRGKRLGDLVAGTYVVRERTAVLGGSPARMPPQLAGWAATADIGRLPDGLALAVRQYLARLPLLHASSRQRLGADLAGQVARRVAPAPPAGTSAEDFLSAVLAERRRRELARLTREQQARARRDAAFARLPFGLDAPERSGRPGR
jgi:uncharacterized RDD family membrane protein YckC